MISQRSVYYFPKCDLQNSSSKRWSFISVSWSEVYIFLFWRITMHISIFDFPDLFYIRKIFNSMFSKLCPYRILLLGINYTIKYLLGNLFNMLHESLCDLDSTNSLAIISPHSSHPTLFSSTTEALSVSPWS